MTAGFSLLTTYFHIAQEHPQSKSPFLCVSLLTYCFAVAKQQRRQLHTTSISKPSLTSPTLHSTCSSTALLVKAVEHTAHNAHRQPHPYEPILVCVHLLTCCCEHRNARRPQLHTLPKGKPSLTSSTSQRCVSSGWRSMGGQPLLCGRSSCCGMRRWRGI